MAEIRTFTTGNDEAADGQDLAVFIRSLLEQMTGRFNHMSTNIINRMDEMESRIDDLEKSIAELMQQVRLFLYY